LIVVLTDVYKRYIDTYNMMHSPKKKSSVPLIWKSHRKAWITRQHFHDWVVDNFVPEINKVL
jgi:hypothetical protein